MTTSLFPCRSALAVAHPLFVAVLLAFVSNAWAGDITYNIVNYPVNQTDNVSSGTDTISGTIITDGTIGPIGPGNIVGGSLTMVTPNMTLTEQIDPSYPDTLLSNMTATATQLLFTPAYYDEVSLFFEPTSGSDIYMNLGYQYGDPTIYAGGISIPDGPGVGGFFASYPPAVPGSIAYNNPWVIAAVPEPASLTLLGSALLGVGVVYLRRPAAALLRGAARKQSDRGPDCL